MHAHGVIDQVAHQHGQQRRVARNGAGRVALKFQRLLFANGFGCQLGHHLLRHGAQIDRRHDGCLQRFQPGQAEQLLDQARGAVAAFERALQCVLAQGVVGFAHRHLRLHADGGNRRAQFVRSIGGKTALGFKQMSDAPEQAVQGGNHGHHLGGRMAQGDRIQRLRLALCQGAPKPPNRLHAPVHRPPHRQPQQGQRHQHRPQGAAQHGPQNGVP